jgi:hypothetical protein
MPTDRLLRYFASITVVLWIFGLSEGFAQRGGDSAQRGEAPARTPVDDERANEQADDEQADDEQADDEQADDEQAEANDVSGQRLLEQAAEIAGEVANIRGLPLLDEIDKGIRDRDQLRQVLLERLAEEVSDEQVENEAKVFKQLGLMPEDLDYKQTLLDVLTEQIAGFYDQNAKELYIMKGLPPELQRPAMAHEIFHGIQDQHFDINRMTAPFNSMENGDFSLARAALIEGDASVVMIDFSLYEQGVLPRDGARSLADFPMIANLLKQLSREDVGALQQMMPQADEGASPIDPSELSDSALAEAPRMISRLLVFPYFGGMRFVLDVRIDHDWERVDEIYERPPVSTEQILHPKRYFAGDEPVLLDFETAPVIDADALIYDSVFGEYQMRLVLEEHLLGGEDEDAQSAVIDQAMTGWGGDRILAYQLGDDADGNVLVSHLSSWDTIPDAHEYFDALVEMLKTRYPDAALSHSRGEHGQAVCMQSTGPDGGERIYVEQWGDLVLHLEGAPSDLDDAGDERDPTVYMLRDQIMHSVVRTPFSDVYDERLQRYDAEQKAGTEAAQTADD